MTTVAIRITDEDGIAVVSASAGTLTGAVPVAATYSVRAMEKDGETWRTVEAPAGETHELPLAVGPDTWITVTRDPVALVAL